MSLLSVLTETVAAFAPTAIAVQESVGYPALDYNDPDIDLPISGGGSPGYRRLTQAPSDLAPITHERMQNIALVLYDKNPLAKRCLELIKDFVVSEGINPTAKDKTVQAMITRFWADGQNTMAARLHTFALELGLWGEQAFAAFVNERSGHVRLISIDPRSIKSAIPDPSNPDLPLAIALLAETGAEARYIKVIRENDEGLLVGAAADETLRLGDQTVPYWSPPTPDGQTRLVGCFFWAVNKVQGATRGRSDLLPVADFLDLYDRLIFDEAERMSFLRAFVFDVTVKGASAAELIAKAANEPPPKPGSVKYHNESEEWKAVTPDLKAQDGATTADLILSLIATGVGLPKTWLNGIMDVNRASAVTMDEPSLKRLRARQQVVMAAVTRMVRFALDQAELAGALPGSDEGRHPFVVDAPEMSSRDVEKAARALFSTIQALGMADAANWIDSETARQVVVLMLGQLGVNVDTAELKERLLSEKQFKADADDYEIPPFFGAGGRPGNDEITKELGGGGASAGEGGARPIAVADPQAWATVLDKVSGVLVELGNSKVIDGQFAQDVVAKLFAMAGIEVDVTAMQARLDAEEEEADADAETDDEDLLADLPLEDELVAEAWRVLADADDEPLTEAVIAVLDADDYIELTDRWASMYEAFDESKIVRGPGGKFGNKAPTDEYSPASASLRAQIEKILGERAGKKGRAAAKPKALKGKAAPKGKKAGGKGPKARSLTKSALNQQIRGLKPGSAITITLANGSTVKGTVDRAAGGVAIVKTQDGAVILHGGLRNVTKIEG